jgi:uncharacterized C2H2 Zn-finger protein
MPSNFKCPKCDFVAKNAAGLGSHKKSAHGISGKSRTSKASPAKRKGGGSDLREAIMALELKADAYLEVIKELKEML